MDKRSRNVLHDLAATNDWDLVDNPGWVPRVSGIETLLRIFRKRVNIQARDSLGRSPLHWVCSLGKVQLTRELLTTNLGLNIIKAVTKREKTALHLAVTHGWTEIVKLLLGHGANFNAKRSTPVTGSLFITRAWQVQ